MPCGKFHYWWSKVEADAILKTRGWGWCVVYKSNLEIQTRYISMGGSASVHAGIHPPGVSLETPSLNVGLENPPGVGLENPPRCGPGEPPWPDPSTSPPGHGPGDPPWDLQGMLGYYLQGMLGYHSPCWKACWDTTCNACWDTTPLHGQNSWHTLLKILPCPKLRLRAVTNRSLSGDFHQQTVKNYCD